MAAGIVHEAPAHRFGRRGQEVGPVFKLQTLRASGPKTGFIHQRARLQRVARTLGIHFVARNPKIVGDEVTSL